MKKGYTDITIILDKSGSMMDIKEQTIEGFNSFLEKQKVVPGKATISLIQFDSTFLNVYTAKPIKEAERLTEKTYAPDGYTALLDAIGRVINETGARLKNMAKDQRPGKVLVVILTDGQENRSKLFNNDKIAEMISHQKDVYKWDFVYLGANQDSFSIANKMNIDAGQTLNFCATTKGIGTAFDTVSTYTANYRCCLGEARDIKFSDEDRVKNSN